MRYGIKGGSIAVLTTAVLATAACGSSGQIGAAAGSASGPGTSVASSGAETASTPPNTSLVPATSGGSAASTGGGAGRTLTTEQITKILLTDKDDPGYTYDASRDSKRVTSTPDVVTSGGSVCQTFVDAENGLSTKYGTTAEVDRELSKVAVGHLIEDSVLAMPSSGKAGAMISDMTASLQGCKKLSATIGVHSGTMELAAIPQLVKSGQIGYVNHLTINGETVLMTADLVQVGSAVSLVALLGPNTSDKAALEQMGATMGHLSDIQVGRLKKAQGLG